MHLSYKRNGSFSFLKAGNLSVELVNVETASRDAWLLVAASIFGLSGIASALLVI